jgi:hypothetical protein
MSDLVITSWLVFGSVILLVGFGALDQRLTEIRDELRKLNREGKGE